MAHNQANARGINAPPTASPPSPSPSPSLPHWDELPLALADGERLRAVTAAAARHGLRAGMTAAAARSRCAALQVLPWDDAAIADAVRQATAAFLDASPQVTPVAGAPGLWWIGAGGLDSLGGEPALARALAHLAQRWHPAPRVAIADSCVAARAGTWEGRGATAEQAGGARPVPPTRIPPGADAAYLATAPLGLVPMAEELRETLGALGIRTAGAFADLTAEDVERRWGAAGLAAWRLARGEDRRRPGLTRADAPRSASAELVPTVTTTEPVLFLVRAALDRLVRDLLGDGRAVAAVAITLALDDAQGALPSNAPAHTITREVRLPRPSARVAPLLERCRTLLDQWPLPAPIRGVTVAIVATAPLGGEQGDLLEPTWRDPAAADAAFARLRAELGQAAIVVPVAHDEHRPERGGGWEDEGLGPKGKGQGKDGRGVDAHPRATSPLPLPPSLRQLEVPEAIEVECDSGAPRVLWWRGRRVRVARAVGPERLAGDWWKDAYTRDYWRCEEADGASDLVLYHDRSSTAGGWFVQGWYD